jgi:6-phosphogluconolactonase (cycloisomerase 2 family)
LIVLLLSACGGGGGGGSTTTGGGTTPGGGTTSSYTIGGAVTGLSGSVVLQNNSGDDITLSANGNFTFASAVADNGTYAVTVLTQPTGQTCSVSTGAGTVSGNNVSNVAVTCATNAYTVGGTVSGLSGSVVLQDNNGDNLTVSANGAYTFATSVAYGSPYSVTVLTQPAGQSCSIANGTGTIATTNVSNVTITCATHTHTIGGTVSGLNGSMVLQNNGADDLAIATNGAFTFPTAVSYGNPYSVTPLSFQYPNQACTISNGSGTVTGNVSDVGVACAKFTAPRYVYVASFHYENVSTYAVDAASGRLKYIGKAAAGAGTWSVTVHPSSKYAYVTGSGGGIIAQYSIGADGVLTATAGVGGTLLGTGTLPTSISAIDPTGKYAYVAGQTAVLQYTIGADGAWTAMTPDTVATGGYPSSIAIDPTGKYAYVANGEGGINPGTVSQYTIGADGALTAMTPATIATGVQPSSITVDLTGKYAYVTSQHEANVSQYSIGANGALTAIGTPVAAGLVPTSITVDPSGKYAYVASWGVGIDPKSNTVEQYSIGADGLLTHLTTVSNWNGGVSIAVAAGAAPVQAVAKYAYVVNKGNNTVSQYTLGANGALTAMPTATVATGAGTNPTSIAVDPSGKYAYVTNGGDGTTPGTVSQYSIGADGALTAMTTVAAGSSNPSFVAVDPAGRYAYVENNSAFSQYKIGADGALTAMTPVANVLNSWMTTRPIIIPHPSSKYALALSKFCLGAFSVDIYGGLTDISGAVGDACDLNWDLISVAVDPSGKYAYAANGVTNTVAQFTLAANGAVASMATPTVAAGVNPKVVAVDPSGKYVYVANKVDGVSPGTLSQYSIGATGGLTAIGALVATGVNPQSITVDPTGKYVYVTNGGDGTTPGSVSQYSIGADGTLTAMVTVAAGVNPVSIATVGTYQ